MLILMRDIISLQRSPFSTVPRSFLKVMTMTTAEFDFDAVFRQDPSGEGDDADEILFPMCGCDPAHPP